MLHFLLHNTPNKYDLRIYRNQLGEEVKTHIALMDAIGADISDLVKSLDYPTDVSSLCASGGTGDKQTTMKWVGEVCENNKIQWNSMTTISNLLYGRTSNQCTWNRADKTGDSNWLNIYGVSILTGIGFTMSLFVGNLAFIENTEYIDGVKIGVLTGSLLSTVFGYFLLYVSSKKQ